MPTTPNGIPKFAQTDSADIASKMNAQADAVDGLITARSFPVAARQAKSTDGRTASVTQSNDKLVTSFEKAGYAIGGIAYGLGVFTLPTPGAGLWHFEIQAAWPASTGSSPYSRHQGVYVNGSKVTAGLQQISVGGGEGGRTYTTGGDIVLADGDSVQAYLLQTGAPTEAVVVNSFTIRRVA